MGGAERSLLDCIASLRAAEPTWKLDVIAAEQGPMLAEARKLGVRAHCLPFPTRFSKLGCFGSRAGIAAIQSLIALPEIAAYFYRLRRAIRKLAPDLIHTNGLKMHLLGAWQGSAPVVWHIHDYLSHRPAIASVLRLSAKRVRAILANSQSVAADVLRLLGHTVLVETMLNGVDLTRFRPRGPRLDLDRLSGLTVAPAGTLRIGLVGTFARWKGQETFLRALAQPQLRSAMLRAYIVGGNIYQTSTRQFSLSELQTLVHELGLEDRVGLTGFVPDIPSAMRALDIVVHASTSPEPFGLVIAEAMASGCAVIASNTGGAAELLSNGRDGLSIPPGDPRVLALAIQSLLLEPVKRSALAAAARITAEARFDRARLGPALSAFYSRSLHHGTLELCESSTSIAEIGTAA